jgi:O-antigen/teichoic acid export membrane protein
LGGEKLTMRFGPRACVSAQSLPENAIHMLIGTASYSACQWVSTILIARLGTTEMLGQFALGLAVSSPIFAFTNLQLRAVQATDALDRYVFADYLGLRGLGTATALLLVAGTALLSPWPSQTRLIVLTMGLRAAVESFSDIVYGYFQKRERMEMVARAMVLRGWAGVVALGIGLRLTRDLVISVGCMTFCWAAGLFLYEWRSLIRYTRRKSALSGTNFRGAASLPRMRQLAVLSLPLAAVTCLLSASQSVPRLVLERHGGERDLGFFSAAATLAGAIGVVFTAVGQAALPRLAHAYIGESPEFVRILSRMLLVGAGLGAAAVAGSSLFGEEILAALYGPSFTPFGRLLVGLLIAAGINNISLFLGVAATASGSYVPQLAASALTLVVAVISAGVLIPAFGIWGAMYSAIVSALAQVAAYGYLCLRILNCRIVKMQLR